MVSKDASSFAPAGSALASTVLPRRRKAGRPAKLSRTIIVQTSLQILDQVPVEDFMVKTVAESLGTTSMAIYRYFPSRDALILAAADEVCRLFRAPKEGATWQDTVTRWLRAIKRHADRHPTMLYVLGLNGRVSREWVRMTVPLTIFMSKRSGLRGKQLTVATYLFGATIASMFHMITDSRAAHAGHLLPRIADITTNDREAKVLRQIRLRSLSEREALDALFAQYIAGIERLLRRRAGG